VEPVGYPDTALICGHEREQYNEVGWIYLLPEEHEEYQDGRRVFGLWDPDSSSSAAKVRVSDESVNRLNQWVEDEDELGNGLQSQSSIDRY